MQKNFSPLFAAVACTVTTIFLASVPLGRSIGKGPDERIERLEKRVDALEQILFATTTLDARKMEQQLAAARQQLKDTTTLFQRGLIADARLENDRFAVMLAEKELELALQPERCRTIISDIQLIDAKRDLEIAKLNLQQMTAMNNRGFASITQITEAERAVTQAEAAVAVAEEKLRRAAELESLRQLPEPKDQDPVRNPDQ